MNISRKKIIIGVVVVLLLAAIAVANLKFRRSDAVTVETEAIKRQNLEAIVSASGKIQPKRSVNISADTMGRVVDLADDTLARQRELWKQGLTTKADLDRAETEAQQRDIEVQNQIKQIETLRIRTGQERANLANARYDLSKVRIESPIDGIVTRRNIEEGETVVIGTMNNAGTVLLTIADMSVIQAEVDVDETDIPNLTLGQTAKITIDAMPGLTLTGKVTETANSPIT